MVEAVGNDIDAAVAVDVTEGAATMARRCVVCEPCFSGIGGPFAADAQIAEYGIGLSELAARRPNGSNVAPRDKEIFPTIVVEVVKSCAESGHSQGKGRACRWERWPQ